MNKTKIEKNRPEYYDEITKDWKDETPNAK